jgi:hypothetical protein
MKKIILLLLIAVTSHVANVWAQGTVDFNQAPPPPSRPPTSGASSILYVGPVIQAQPILPDVTIVPEPSPFTVFILGGVVFSLVRVTDARRKHCS